MITIITATYNASATLCHSLTSVQKQSIPLEHLLIDGDSKDNTLEIIKRHAKAVIGDSLFVTGNCKSDSVSPNTNHQLPVIRYLSQPDNGIYDAMNKGLRLASGEVIGILNADDFYAGPDVLSHVASVFDDSEVEACFGDLVYVRETKKSDIDREGIQGPETQNFKVLRYWRSGPFRPNKFKWGWMPPHPTFFVRRRVYEKYGLFNLNLGTAADYELMLRFLYKYCIKVAYIPEVLVCMRAGGVSNASLQNRLKANRMDRKAWEVNGLRPYPWTTWLKPVRKIPQYWRRMPGVDGNRYFTVGSVA